MIASQYRTKRDGFLARNEDGTLVDIRTAFGYIRQFSRAEKALIVLFMLTLPFVQLRIRGDGIAYYAFARSLLVDHNLQFRNDWKDPRSLPVLNQRDRTGRILSVSHYTKTNHVANMYPVGPAILWAPFLILTHSAVLVARHLGWSGSADGFSRPYLLTMAASTALYGFLGLWLSFRLARIYFDERWAFWATVGIWFGSSLTVYMYLDPSWSHAQSAFTVALLLWYWHRTRGTRKTGQWMVLGLISGLACDVYFANAVFLLVPLVEALADYGSAWKNRGGNPGGMQYLLRSHFLYAASTLIAFLPTLVARRVIFGNPLALGSYANNPWHWTSPALWKILFASAHGLFTTTPILLPAIAGLYFIYRREPEIGKGLLAAAAAFYLLIAVYPWWDGVASFGNRFFVSLTPIFVLGLSATLSVASRVWKDSEAASRRIACVSILLIFWNLGLVFQWNEGLLPDIGPVYWHEIVYNQIRVVPGDVVHALHERLTGRGESPSDSGGI